MLDMARTIEEWAKNGFRTGVACALGDPCPQRLQPRLQRVCLPRSCSIPNVSWTRITLGPTPRHRLLLPQVVADTVDTQPPYKTGPDTP